MLLGVKITTSSVLNDVAQARQNKVGIVVTRPQQQKKNRSAKSRVRTTGVSSAGFTDIHAPSGEFS